MVVEFHEEHGWLLVGSILMSSLGAGMPGIHMSNLYPAIHRELEKFGWSQMMILMNLRQSENIGFDGELETRRKHNLWRQVIRSVNDPCAEVGNQGKVSKETLLRFTWSPQHYCRFLQTR